VKINLPFEKNGLFGISIRVRIVHAETQSTRAQVAGDHSRNCRLHLLQSRIQSSLGNSQARGGRAGIFESAVCGASVRAGARRDCQLTPLTGFTSWLFRKYALTQDFLTTRDTEEHGGNPSACYRSSPRAQIDGVQGNAEYIGRDEAELCGAKSDYADHQAVDSR
jgi:hypothetical protein